MRYFLIFLIFFMAACSNKVNEVKYINNNATPSGANIFLAKNLYHQSSVFLRDAEYLPNSNTLTPYLVARQSSAAKKSFQIMKTASEYGLPEALLVVGEMYYNGFGIEQSYNDALIFYKKALAAGNVTASLRLGYMYEHGLGVDKNPRMAKRLYIGAGRENPEANFELGRCISQMACSVESDEYIDLYKKSAELGSYYGAAYYGRTYLYLSDEAQIKGMHILTDEIKKHPHNTLGNLFALSGMLNWANKSNDRELYVSCYMLTKVLEKHYDENYRNRLMYLRREMSILDAQKKYEEDKETVSAAKEVVYNKLISLGNKKDIDNIFINYTDFDSTADNTVFSLLNIPSI